MELTHTFDSETEIRDDNGELIFLGPAHRYRHEASDAEAVIAVPPNLPPETKVTEAETRLLAEEQIAQLLRDREEG